VGSLSEADCRSRFQALIGVGDASHGVIRRVEFIKLRGRSRTDDPDFDESDLPMTQSTKRSILRWIHIVFSIPIIGYVYSPFDKIPEYAGPTRYVFLPVLALTGLWMWKGPAIGRLFSRRASGESE